MLGLFSRIKSTVKSIRACRGRWKSFEDWGRRPWVGSSMAAAEFPCHRLRGFRHGVLALLELGARLGCWSYRTACVLGREQFNARSVGEKHTMFESRVSLGYDCWDCSVSNIICHGSFNDNDPSVIARRWTV